MWNKLFKSKSKSSKNLSTSSSSHSNGGGSSSSPPLDLVPIYNIDNRIRYGDDDFEPPADDVELRRNHNRDSIGPQMCGIPMRKSKFSSAFKSLSLRRGSTKNQLKLYPGEATPVDESPIAVEDVQISAKRASLRPSKSGRFSCSPPEEVVFVTSVITVRERAIFLPQSDLLSLINLRGSATTGGHSMVLFGA